MEPAMLHEIERLKSPNVPDMYELLWNAEMVDVRWQPWRASVAAIVRLGDALDLGGFAVVVARYVSSFSYTTSKPLVVPGFRSVGGFDAGPGEGLSYWFDIAPDERVSFACRGAVVVTGETSKPGHSSVYPDYSQMSEPYLSRLQPTWDHNFVVDSFTAFGLWQ